MAVYLVPIGQGRTIVLDKAVVFVGRHPDCDVVLTNSRKVSRKHCCICQVNETYVIRDLGSMNGIRLNGQRVKKEGRIEFGDEVSIGDVTFRLQRTKGTAPPREPVAEVPERSAGRPAPATRRPPAPVQRPAAPKPRRPPLELSQEFPVPLEEDGQSFAVFGGRGDIDSDGTVGPNDEIDDVPEAMIIDDDSEG